MKGRIFIGWSGTPALAETVKQKIEKEDYACIVGGESGMQKGLHVGEAVLREINLCSQAIFVVEKKDFGDFKMISNNLMFELGYCLSKFNSKKIHIFYIDIDKKDKSIPSDLEGIWATYLSREELLKTNALALNEKEQADTDAISNTFIAEKITSVFTVNQKCILPQNKMDIINTYYSMKAILNSYDSSNPQQSDYEFAQQLIFFSQAAYLFGDCEEAYDLVNSLMDKFSYPSEELEYSLKFALCYLKIFKFNKQENGALFMERTDYRNLLSQFKEQRNKVKGWEEKEKNDYTLWMQAFIADSINFLSMLYAAYPNIDPNERIRTLRNSLPYAEECLSYCCELEQNPQNEHFVELYKAYMYRNMAMTYLQLEEDKNLVADALKNSFEERTKLLNHYRAVKVNSTLLEAIEMEHYLAVSEQLDYIDDEDLRYDYAQDCRDYILKLRDVTSQRSHFISLIENHISSI